jgi:hypothetical protein
MVEDAMRVLLLLCAVVMVVGVGVAPAQFKSQVAEENRLSQGIYSQSSSSGLFDWFDPSKFSMHHSFSMSYMTLGGGQGMSLGTYTNSMLYEFSDKLNARADISLSYSPYNSFSSGLTGSRRNDLSGLYLSRAELNYRPWENTRIQLSFRQLPYGSYSYYSPFYDPWYREGGF